MEPEPAHVAVRSAELERLQRLGWDASRFPANEAGVHVAGDQNDVDYPDEGLAALGFHGGAGYWFDHRARAVVDALQRATDARAMWDVGAGTGAMSTRLTRAGYDVVAVEPLPAGANAIAAQGDAAVFCGSLEQLQLPDDALRIVGMFDVIEHLADPTVLLREVHRVLEPGGIAVITVPALPALWSSEDEVAGHHRRYTRKQLDVDMQTAGFTRISSEYLFASLVPPGFVVRAVPYRLGRRKAAADVHAATAKQLAPNPRVDAVATGVLRAERAVSRVVPLPAGLSVLGLYRVPGAGTTLP